MGFAMEGSSIIYIYNILFMIRKEKKKMLQITRVMDIPELNHKLSPTSAREFSTIMLVSRFLKV